MIVEIKSILTCVLCIFNDIINIYFHFKKKLKFGSNFYHFNVLLIWFLFWFFIKHYAIPHHLIFGSYLLLYFFFAKKFISWFYGSWFFKSFYVSAWVCLLCFEFINFSLVNSTVDGRYMINNAGTKDKIILWQQKIVLSL